MTPHSPTRLSGPLATWAVLVALTLLSYVAWVDPALLAPGIAGSIAIVIAMTKAWLIGMRFMELDEAVIGLRIAYAVWIALVGIALLVMFALA